MGTSRVSGLAASVMAFHGPSYGLSRECAMKSQAKFSAERAKECVDWIEEVIGAKLEMEVKDQVDFGTVLNDGALQAAGEHRDVPQGLRRLRPQGARPLPGERLVRKQEPLYGGGQPLQPWWHDPEEWLGRPSAGGEAGDREQAPV